MARILGVSEKQAGIFNRFVYRFCRKRFGKIPEPLTITAHHSWIAKGSGAYEFALERSRLVAANLKGLAGLKAATLVGCPF